jgi:hypothetical protein
MCVNEMCCSGSLVQGNVEAIGLVAESRISAYVRDDVPHAIEETRVVENWHAGRDAEAIQPTRSAYQARSLRQCSHWHGPIIRRHSAKLAPCDESCACAKFAGA